MAPSHILMMLKFRPFSTFYRTPALCTKHNDQVPAVLMKLNRPKRPTSGFFIFLNEARKELRQRHPDKPMTELTKLASQQWAQMAEKEKSQYNLKYAMEYEEFKSQMNNFLKECSEDKQKNEWLKQNKRITEADKRIMGKPKPPRLSFFTFLSNVRKSSSLKSENQEQLLNKARQKWKCDTDPDKKKFDEEKLKATEKYEKELLKWESDMFNKGYYELVRPRVLKILRGT